MNKTWKVAKWEIKRNMKNKSFVIGLFLTPIMFIAFAFLGSIFGDSGEGENTKVFVKDDLNVFPVLEQTVGQFKLDMKLQKAAVDEKKIKDELEEKENTAYIFLTEKGLEEGVFPVYTSDDVGSNFEMQMQMFSESIKAVQLGNLGLTPEQMETIAKPIVFQQHSVEELSEGKKDQTDSFEKTLKDAVPGIFAGIILFSIVVTGMMIFTSASQEKKDKIAEIILSSVTTNDLMQGKIIGYFVLGIIQALVILLFGIPFAMYQFDFPFMEYLLVPETILLIIIALLGYLLFASLFVGIGATMADMSTAGNFQGLVMMLPFLPVIFIGPVFSNPNGLWAQIGSYIPFSSPGVWIMRLSVLDKWPWWEIAISLAILAVSIWLCMKLAGKIFKVGILMYGKNATPQEIWKWIRA